MLNSFSDNQFKVLDSDLYSGVMFFQESVLFMNGKGGGVGIRLFNYKNNDGRVS